MEIFEKIASLKPVQQIIQASKKISLPGFSKIPIYYVMDFFIKGMNNGVIGTRAASMAFRFFLALFPGIIFLFTLIPYIPIDGFNEELFSLLQNILPPSAYELAKETIDDIILNKNGSVMSLNFVFAIIFASNGVKGMVEAFNNGANIENKRSFLSQQFVSLLLVLILTFILLLSIAAIVFTGVFSNYIETLKIIDDSFLVHLLEIGTWIILLTLFFFASSFIYYYGPSKQDKWKFFSPGATLSSLLTVVTSFGFSYYVTNFSQYNKLYGSIGTLIVIMLWLYFNSFILLIGFELNTSLKSANNQLPTLK